MRQGINWTGASAAARNEVLFLGHMATAHSLAMQLLDREGEARLLTERTRRTGFLTNAREALGALLLSVLTCPHCLRPRRFRLLMSLHPDVGKQTTMSQSY